MRDLVIGDVHFGIKSNSMTWLESHLKFFRTQVYDAIETEKPDRVIFLGDVFDIRYSINTVVGTNIKKLVREMLTKFNNCKFFFTAGNHDYYSPQIEFEEYNSYDFVFGEEFTNIHSNVKFITQQPLLDNETLFLPWYWTEDEDRFSRVMQEYKGRFKLIYCHSDLSKWESEKILAKSNALVISGHIHYPWSDKTNKLFNVGACNALTFNDVNSERYIYVVENNVLMKAIENMTTPKFYRYFNEEIFTLSEENFTNASVQLCINTENINKARYIERIKEIKTTYMSNDIKVVKIDDITGIASGSTDFNTNIQEYIEKNIPDYLTPKYQFIKQKISIDKQ